MKYDLNFFGIKISKTSDSIWVIIISLLLIIPITIGIAYLMSCLILYAFVQLTGLLAFNWINGFWTFILLMAGHWMFNGGKND